MGGGGGGIKCTRTKPKDRGSKGDKKENVEDAAAADRSHHENIYLKKKLQN